MRNSLYWHIGDYHGYRRSSKHHYYGIRLHRSEYLEGYECGFLSRRAQGNLDLMADWRDEMHLPRYPLKVPH